MKRRYTRPIAIGIAAVLATAGMSDAFAQDHQDIINIIQDRTDRLPRAWNTALPPFAERFITTPPVLPQSVIDRETNLLWERQPDPGTQTWFNANAHCIDRFLAVPTPGAIFEPETRFGWRLPTVHELMTLVAGLPQQNPSLPVGHPFLGITTELIWTATTFRSITARPQNPADNTAWVVDMGTGRATLRGKSNVAAAAWCVRAPEAIRSE
jgi:hypothetical protein